eukprot:3392988-Pleurochrysis_carterae.AAC.2
MRRTAIVHWCAHLRHSQNLGRFSSFANIGPNQFAIDLCGLLRAVCMRIHANACESTNVHATAVGAHACVCMHEHGRADSFPRVCTRRAERLHHLLRLLPLGTPLPLHALRPQGGRDLPVYRGARADGRRVAAF